MNIDHYLDIIKVHNVTKKNPTHNEILLPLIQNKNLDSVSYTITNISLLKDYIDNIDIIQNLNFDHSIEINNYKLKYKEYFPILTLENINIKLNNKCTVFKVYKLNNLNRLEFNYYNKININNNYGLKIKNGMVK